MYYAVTNLCTTMSTCGAKPSSEQNSNMPTDQIDIKDLPILHRVGAKEHRSKEMHKLLAEVW